MLDPWANHKAYDKALEEARTALAEKGVVDPLQVVLDAHRALRDAGGSLYTKSGWVSMKDRVREFTDPAFFDPVERRLLEALVAAYGDDVLVFMDARGEFKFSLMLLRTEFIPARQRAAIVERGGSPLMTVFDVYEKWEADTEEGLFKSLLQAASAEHLPFLQAALRPALGAPYTDENGVRHIPTWTNMVRDPRPLNSEGPLKPYRRLPVLGKEVVLPNVAALFHEGVVVRFGRRNYRVWFDYTPFIGEEAEEFRYFVGEKVLRVQRTEDPVTTVPLDPGKFALNTMLGHGRSQQGFVMAPFCGQEPRCLMVFEDNMADYTFCVMVTLDDSGEIEFAWVEGSCT
jgi:hypothetical protein